jgi:glycosyltransferase involved in cell wall biosynthesis
MLGKVCIITTVHRVFDGRIFHKEAKTLAKAGYEVTLIAQHDKNEIVEGIKITPLSKPKNRITRIFGLSWQVLKLSIKQNCDIYHFHDPELILIGILLKIIYQKKVVYDVHEDVPKQILSKKWIGNKSIRIGTAFFINLLEKLGALLFDGIIAATETIAKKFPKKKTIVLRNFPILKLIDDANPLNVNKDLPIIIYAGGLTYDRGLKEIIQAMEYVGNKAELWLVGKWESKAFENECTKLEGWEYTKYLGFKIVEEVYSIMKCADIGIYVPRLINRYKVGLPTKAFEYMACPLPMVLTDLPYRRKIFVEASLYAKPHDIKDISKQIIFLLNNKDKAEEIGKKGRELVESEYNWEKESKKLVKYYKKLIDKK